MPGQAKLLLQHGVLQEQRLGLWRRGLLQGLLEEVAGTLQLRRTPAQATTWSAFGVLRATNATSPASRPAMCGSGEARHLLSAVSVNEVLQVRLPYVLDMRVLEEAHALLVNLRGIISPQKESTQTHARMRQTALAANCSCQKRGGVKTGGTGRLHSPP